MLAWLNVVLLFTQHLHASRILAKHEGELDWVRQQGAHSINGYVVQDVLDIQCALVVATKNCHDHYIHTSSSGFCSLPVWKSTKAFWISLCR